jgi:hypothetical protein
MTSSGDEDAANRRRARRDVPPHAPHPRLRGAEGVFHESLNIAALWKLPVVYLDGGALDEEQIARIEAGSSAQTRPPSRDAIGAAVRRQLGAGGLLA